MRTLILLFYRAVVVVCFRFTAQCTPPDTVRYQQFNQRRKFVDAEAHCVEMGGHLASATNQNEKEAIFDMCKPFRYG